MFWKYVIACLLCFILLTGCAGEIKQDVMILDQAIFHLEGDEDTSTQNITLPDSWNKSRPDVGGVGVYQFIFNLEHVPEGLWAILLPRVSNNVKVYLNGDLLGEHGSFEGHSIVWNTPFLLTIPQGFLYDGLNTLKVKVQAKENAFGRLLPLLMGDEKIIKGLYKELYFGQVTLSEICGVFAFTMGVSLLFIWWCRRDSLYGWFALGGLFWSFYALYFFVTDLPFSLEYWIRFCFSSSFVMLSAMLIFICTFMQWKLQRYMKFIIYTALLGSLLLYMLPGEQLFHAITWVMAVYAVMYSVLGIALINALRFAQSKRHALTSLIGIGVNIGLGLHDWANIFFLLNQPYLLQYGQPLIFLVIGRHLLKDYMMALQNSEATNANLDRQVREREIALKAALEKTKQAEQEKLLLKERERIMADIHDGVGGHLVSALSVAESSMTETSQIISQNIHQALDELRIVIDSLDVDEQSFPQMLADFRHRYQLRLEKQNIHVQWSFEDMDKLSQLRPDQSLQVMRILQELITNIIKHAEATVVKVSLGVFCSHAKDICRLDVEDNGVGFDVNQVLGRGLGNLKRRASSIDGEQVFLPCQKGTKARLVFPTH